MLDRSKVLGIVMAHVSVRDTVLRHIPYWLKTCGHLLIVTPLEHKLHIKHPEIELFQSVNNVSSYSKETNMRVYECLKLARDSYQNYPYVMLFEYDSLCWGPIPDRAIPLDGWISATKFMNEPVSPVPGKKFLANYYLHYPQIYTRESLEKITDSMERLTPWDAEYGYTDRYIGMASERAGIPVFNLLEAGLSYSWENISCARYPSRVQECIAAIKGGAFASHGIKDLETLKTISEKSPFGYLQNFNLV